MKLRVCNRPVARAVTNTDHSSHDMLGHAGLGKPWYACGSRQLTLTTTILIPPRLFVMGGVKLGFVLLHLNLPDKLTWYEDNS
jgi:hypothetical protein